MDFAKLLQKIKTILLEPQKFFQKLKEKDCKTAFIYFAITLGFSVVMSLLVSLVFQGFISIFAGSEAMKNGVISAMMMVGYYVVALPMSFVGAGVLYLWIRLFKVKQPYVKAYQLMVYSGTPSRLFSWIPLIGYFAWIYDMIIFVIGIQKTHKVTLGKALLITLLPIAIIFLIGLIVAVGFVLFIMTAYGTG